MPTRLPVGTLERLESLLREATRLPPSADIEAVRCSAGLTNEVYKVRARGKSYAVRLASPLSEELGIVRAQEQHLHRVAAGLGIAPRLLHATPTGDQVVEWVGPPTRPVTREERIRETVGLLKRLHDAPTPRAASYEVNRTQDVLNTIAALKPHSMFDTVAGTLDDVVNLLDGTYWEAGQKVILHNDLASTNVIFSGTRAWLIDWEYAGVGSCFNDLASLARRYVDTYPDHGILDIVLERYFGRTSPELRSTLLSFIHANTAAWITWALVQLANGAHGDYDYEGEARKVAEALPGIRSFGELLGDV